MEISVGQKFKPTYLIELVNYGIDEQWFSNNVIYEVLEQLYNTD